MTETSHTAPDAQAPDEQGGPARASGAPPPAPPETGDIVIDAALRDLAAADPTTTSTPSSRPARRCTGRCSHACPTSAAEIGRLDAELVRRGLARSRGEARDLVTTGLVTVDGPRSPRSRRADVAADATTSP